MQWSSHRRVWLGLTGGLALAALSAAPAQPAPAVVWPAALVDARGNTVDLGALAERGRLFVVTLKATSCPVCREQLRRIMQLLPRLQACGGTFVAVAPGTPESVAALADESAVSFPVIADADGALARLGGLRLDADQMVPAVIELDGGRRVIWEHRGRSAGAFSDAALLQRLECKDLPSA